MRPGTYEEKRRFKRLDLNLPAIIKQTLDRGEEEVQKGVTVNVSFNGACVININIDNIQQEDTIDISLSVPRDEARDFPFSRVIGKARVVRVDKDGVAVEFNEDISRLFIAT